MALPANITAESDSNVLTIAASNNKGLLIRFLNEQVEDGFYALVIDYLKDSNFDLKNMMVDDDVKTTIKDKMPKIFDNEDDIEEDDLFADDLDLEMEDANRDYVTINPDDSEKSEEAAAEEPVEEAKAEDADAE